MTDYSYSLIYKPESDAVDISEWVDRIDAYEVGSGEIRNAKIRLNAMDGRFITKTWSGTTPLIDEFDKIQLQITDRNGDVYDVTYEVDNLKPIQNSQVGQLIEVECLAMEWPSQKTPFSKPFFEESGFQVAKGIGEIYTDPSVRGTNSQIANLIDHQDTFANGQGNEFPKYTANVYPFDLREQSIYTGWMVTNDKMGGSVSSGGAGEFFDIGFEDDHTDPNFNTIKFRGFISGSPPDQLSIPTIDDTLSVNPGEEEGGLASTMGYYAGVWGADGIGTMPYENGLFAGALELWNLFPAHDPAVSYPEDAIVLIPSARDSRGDFVHYKANKATGTQPPSGDWDQYYFDHLASI